MTNEKPETAAQQRRREASEERARKEALAADTVDRADNEDAEDRETIAESVADIAVDDAAADRAEGIEPLPKAVQQTADRQAEAARKGQEATREARLQEMMLGASGEEETGPPKGFRKKSLGDEVFYAYDWDGIIEYLPATVIDTEPWGGGIKLPEPMDAYSLNLGVKTVQRRHNSNRQVVLRLNVPFGEGKEHWLASKPDGADRNFEVAMARRIQREALQREAAIATPERTVVNV